MPNRILVTITLSLFFFQLAFSLIYSNIIVEINQKFSETNNIYSRLSSTNQDLQLQYVKKYAINR